MKIGSYYLDFESSPIEKYPEIIEMYIIAFLKAQSTYSFLFVEEMLSILEKTGAILPGWTTTYLKKIEPLNLSGLTKPVEMKNLKQDIIVQFTLTNSLSFIFDSRLLLDSKPREPIQLELF